MTLRDHQARVARVCFDHTPSEDDLEALAKVSSRDRWLIYRNMIRIGLKNSILHAFPKTASRMGAELNTLIDEWMHEFGSQERLFRNVPLEFYQRMHTRVANPVWAESLRYEKERWWVRFAPDPEKEVVEFSFDARPALNPASTLMVLKHPVHDDTLLDEASTKAGEHRLIVYRDKEFRGTAFTLNETAYQIIERWQQGDTMTDSVQKVMQARGSAVDQRFLETLSALLADFLTRGILLGSWAS